MTAGTIDTAIFSDYQLRLPMFEGPLDVLLRLIERSQLSITDISLLAVTEQFLDYIGSLVSAPPDLIAEFTNVGARLVLLKSRSLLPRPPAQDDDEEVGDLARELIEYRAVKEAASQLADRDKAGLGLYGRGGAVISASTFAPPKLAMHEANLLARAVRRRLSVIPAPRTLLATARLVSLREMVERVLTLLDGRREIYFSKVAAECQDASELRAAFLALLVLIRRRVVDADQIEPFGDIAIVPGAVSPAALSTLNLEEQA